MTQFPVVSYATMEDYRADFGYRLPRDEAPDVVCDFCCRERGAWTYPCDDYVMQRMRLPDGSETDYRSQGSWSACGACSELVEAGDLDGLVARNIEMTEKTRDAEKALRMVYEGFFEHRFGRRVDGDWLQARCDHPAEYLRVTSELAGSINPHHHQGIICGLCGVNLAPQLLSVPLELSWHRSVGLRRA